MENPGNTTGHPYRLRNIVRGENCHLFDTDGNRFLDLESGVWCTALGHSHPAVLRALTEQAGNLLHSGFNYLHPVSGEAAEAVLRITGLVGGEATFLNSGSEAVAFAVKIARHLAPGRDILTLADSYLGAQAALETGGPGWRRLDWLGGGNLDTLPFDQIGAFVFEPGSSLGLVRFPPVDLIREICRRVRGQGGLVIANEVTTGMGRTGEWFGCNHYGITPDLVALGKGLGNGYPVSAVAVSEAVVARIDPAKFRYAQSHQNDPGGAAVALAVIGAIESEELLSSCREKGRRIIGGLERIREDHGVIREIRGRGLMLAIECEGGREYAGRIYEALLGRRILLVRRPGTEVLRLDPALTIPDEDIQHFFDALEEIVEGL